MSQELDKEPFTEAHWGEVQAFDCGDEVYELEVSDWLKGPFGQDSALTTIRHPAKPSKVWLYRLADGTLVGFGAIGESQWRWKGKKDPKIPVTLIIWLAIAKQFQGLPKAHVMSATPFGNRRFDRRSVKFPKRTRSWDCASTLKTKKRSLYINGTDLPKSWIVRRDTGTRYMRMAIILNDEALLQIKNAMTKKK